MAHVSFRDGHEFDLDAPTLVEGLPGAGLVGKIAADYLVERLEMPHVADVRCDGLPRVAVYRGDDPATRAPVRLHADAERDLLVLASDVPVSPSAAPEFADCITGWLADNGVFPVYLSGLTEKREGVPDVYGIAAGGATDRLEATGARAPPEGGLVSGPTGALLARADAADLPAICLIVRTEGQFPDPEAARAILDGPIAALTGIEIDTATLIERAEEVRAARERLAQQLQDAGDESSEAQPIRGFQ